MPEDKPATYKYNPHTGQNEYVAPLNDRNPVKDIAIESRSAKYLKDMKTQGKKEEWPGQFAKQAKTYDDEDAALAAKNDAATKPLVKAAPAPPPAKADPGKPEVNKRNPEAPFS